MTDLPVYPGTEFDGSELLEIVAPGSAALGINYAISTLQIASLLPAFTYKNTIITSGATIGSPYAVLATDTRVLFNKTIGAASYALLGMAAVQRLPVLIKDLKGDADVNPITVNFTGGETVDGLPQVVISTPYGGYWFNPLASGNWYLGTG